MLFEKLWKNRQKWYWSVIVWICFFSVDFGSGTTLPFSSSDGKTFFSMYKLKTYVSESIMYGNDNFSSSLLIPFRPDDFFPSLYIYLPSSETERYGIINGSCPLVFILQKSCRGFEHSYTFVLCSIIILTQTGNDYWKHLQLVSSGCRQK